MKKQEKTIKQHQPKMPQSQNLRRPVKRAALFHRKGSRNS